MQEDHQYPFSPTLAPLGHRTTLQRIRSQGRQGAHGITHMEYGEKVLQFDRMSARSHRDSTGKWYLKFPVSDIHPSTFRLAHGRSAQLIGPIQLRAQDIRHLTMDFFAGAVEQFHHYPDTGPSHILYKKDNVYYYFIID